MKIISFEIAKAIKKAGYPREWHDTEYYYTVSGELKRADDYEGRDIMFYQRLSIPAPYVFEVWLWLWQEKKIYFGIEAKSKGICLNNYEYIPYRNPEEAIISAIEYLVDNNLIL